MPGRVPTGRWLGVAAAAAAGLVLVGCGAGLEDPGRALGDTAGDGPPSGQRDKAEPDAASDAREAPPDLGDAQAIDVETPVPIELLAVRFLSSTSFATVDLEDGEVTSLTREARGLSREPVDGAALTDGGVVIWQADATVRVFSEDDLSEPTLEHAPADLDTSTPQDAAPAVSAVPTLDGHALWVVQQGRGCCGDPRPGQAELVDLDSGEVVTVAKLPPDSRPVAAIRDGLVLNTLRYVETADGWVGEEGSHTVLTLSEEGVVNELSAGEALAATESRAAVVDCRRHEPRTDCRLGLVDVATSERVQVQAPADGTWGPVGVPNAPTNTPPWSAVARHGHILVSLREETSAENPHVRRHRLVVIDATDETDPAADVVHELDSTHLSAAWDKRGEHVIAADAMEPHLTVIDPADGSSFMIHDAIPDEHYLIGLH